jgi:hypothetical protein
LLGLWVAMIYQGIMTRVPEHCFYQYWKSAQNHVTLVTIV